MIRTSYSTLVGRAVFTLLCVAAGATMAPGTPAQATAGNGSGQDVRYEHRIVIPTTALDREADVEASLERNVNRLAASGFQVAAFVGGDAVLLDELLGRKAYVAGLVDHAGQVLVVMTRPVGRIAPPREYRLLHTRTPRGTDVVVAGLGDQGFRLGVAASVGSVFHAAFERREGIAPVAQYRVFANRGRSSWMAQIQGDGDVLARLRRVVPMGLDFALAELGTEASAPAALEWFSRPVHEFASQDSALQTRAALGYHVQWVRIRATTTDVLLVKPAGWGGPAPTYSLEDGPWGGPCSRGTIAGADVFTDGDTYCVARNPSGPVTNRGVDLLIRPEATAGGRPLLDVPSCEDRARLASNRPVDLRIIVARQLERALNDKVPPGFRIARAFAGADGRGTRRLTVFTTNEMPEQVPEPGTPEPAAALRPDRDERLDGSAARLEEELTTALRRDPLLAEATVWVEVQGATRPTQIRLAGCASTRLDREQAERSLRSLLVRTAAPDARVRNDVLVDRWR